MAQAIVLASTSQYRAELLSRLGFQFTICAPEVDETPELGELPDALATRLALSKAKAGLTENPAAIIIGSDQVAAVYEAKSERSMEQILGKPGSLDQATEQLTQMSGKMVNFYTAVAVIEGQSGKLCQQMEVTQVLVRNLTQSEIQQYLALEQPFDCTGSFKIEGSGIALLEQVQSNDPTALVGLPLISVARMLRKFGHAARPMA